MKFLHFYQTVLGTFYIVYKYIAVNSFPAVHELEDPTPADKCHDVTAPKHPLPQIKHGLIT